MERQQVHPHLGFLPRLHGVGAVEREAEAEEKSPGLVPRRESGQDDAGLRDLGWAHGNGTGRSPLSEVLGPLPSRERAHVGVGGVR